MRGDWKDEARRWEADDKAVLERLTRGENMNTQSEQHTPQWACSVLCAAIRQGMLKRVKP